MTRPPICPSCGREYSGALVGPVGGKSTCGLCAPPRRRVREELMPWEAQLEMERDEGVRPYRARR